SDLGGAILTHINLACPFQSIGIHKKGGMRGIKHLVGGREVVKKDRHIALGHGVQRHAWFIKQENATWQLFLWLHQENPVKAQEPLQPCAAILQLHFGGTAIIGYPDTKMIAVGLKSEPIVALLPPLTKFLGQLGPGGLQQDGSGALVLRNLSHLLLTRVDTAR